MHAHVARIVSEECKKRGWRSSEVLDVGCGDGRLMSLLAETGLSVSGLDVDDSAVQHPDFFGGTRSLLERQHPGNSWGDRLFRTSSLDPWPFPSSSMDIVVSNQVGEHVADMPRFLAECARVLRTGGFAVHVFPLEQYSVEGHTGMPFGHRILSGDLRSLYFSLVARAGLSRVGPLRIQPGETPSGFGRSRSDYVTHETHNHTWKQVATSAAATGLVPSYRYSLGAYLLKSLGPSNTIVDWYYGRHHPLVDGLSFRPLSRLSSVTVFLDRKSEFDPMLNSPGHGRSL